MTDFGNLIQTLTAGQVDFILIGGVAATVHGSPRLTQDVDVVYSRQPDNIVRLVQALAPQNPYLRGAPAGLPFHWDCRTIEQGLNFTLTTSSGYLDLFGEITGGGGFDDLLPHCIEITAFGVELRCLDLATLIRVKRAAGRPKDFESLAELEAILDQQRQ